MPSIRPAATVAAAISASTTPEASMSAACRRNVRISVGPDASPTV